MTRKAFPLTDLGVKVVPPFDTHYIGGDLKPQGEYYGLLLDYQHLH